MGVIATAAWVKEYHHSVGWQHGDGEGIRVSRTVVAVRRAVGYCYDTVADIGLIVCHVEVVVCFAVQLNTASHHAFVPLIGDDELLILQCGRVHRSGIVRCHRSLHHPLHGAFACLLRDSGNDVLVLRYDDWVRECALAVDGRTYHYI